MIEYGYVKDHTWATNPEPVPGMLLRVLCDHQGKHLCGQIGKALQDLKIYCVAGTDVAASADRDAYRDIFFPQDLGGIHQFFQLIEKLHVDGALNHRASGLLDYVDELEAERIIDRQKVAEIKESMPSHRAAAAASEEAARVAAEKAAAVESKVPVIDELDVICKAALAKQLPQMLWATERQTPAATTDAAVSPARCAVL